MTGKETPSAKPRGLQPPPFMGPAASQLLPTVTEEQKQQFLKVFQELIKKFSAHKPILKSLQDLGVKPIIKTVAIDGQDVECVVIPAAELMQKEYAHLVGVSLSDLSVQ